MGVKTIVAHQYRAIVDRAAASFGEPAALPGEGWIAIARKSLGMSAAQLARRLGVGRARISNMEKAERSGGVTLKTMQATAEAMGCRFVYAVVPNNGSVEAAIEAQARHKARMLVATASTHMALERQSLPDAEIRAEIDRITDDLIRRMPSDFWDET